MEMPISIFSPDKALPELSAMQMLNYAIFLSGFKYTIEYRTTLGNQIADYSSRSPLAVVAAEDDVSIFQTRHLDTMPVTWEKIQKETTNDATLRQIYHR
jgi:hypothetical protein